MTQGLTIHHDLAEVKIKPSGKVHQKRLKTIICTALDEYQQAERERISADKVHLAVQQRHGDYYRTPGYFLRLYRNRADLTQIDLSNKTGIRQHHLSEMEHNKRPIGKSNAKKLAAILNCNYQKFL